MFHTACEAAALNVRINLNSISDHNFNGWKEEAISLLKTSRAKADAVLDVVRRKIAGM
ncbi:MAG: hypothetical protein HY960_14205 [Ignavibacteriae bacterium]|nr:hypothetical protein [Ignavibacteriota bacterium]